MKIYNGLDSSLPSESGYYLIIREYYPQIPMVAFFDKERRIFTSSQGIGFMLSIFDYWDDLPRCAVRFSNKLKVITDNVLNYTIKEGIEIIVQDKTGYRFRGIAKMTPSGFYYVYQDDYPRCRIEKGLKYIILDDVDWEVKYA